MPTKLTVPALIPHDAPELHREFNRKLREHSRAHNESVDAAAKALASTRQAITTSYRGPTDMDQLGWSERNDLVMGGTREGYVFVQVPKGSK